MGPIFNEKIDKKWNLLVHEQCTDVLFIGKSQHLRLLFMHGSLNSSRTPPKTRENKKKNKKKERKEQNAASHKRKRTLSAIQTSTKTTHFHNYISDLDNRSQKT